MEYSKKTNIDWSKQPLGKVSDSEIAGRIGVASQSVHQARRDRNILPYGNPKNYARKNIDWDSQPLGKISDSKLANQLGVNRTTVLRARTSRGIPPANGNGWH